MARYGKTAQKKVEKAMHERKRGQLKSGRSGKTVKSRKQAIAIGLSEARERGAKVPPKKSAGGSRKSTSRGRSSGSSGRKRTASRKRTTSTAGRKRTTSTASRKRTTGRKRTTARSRSGGSRGGR